jgi:segregation and condensation protein B
MFGTTRDFLDYFGLKKLEDLPTLAEIKDSYPELSPQSDLLESLEGGAEGIASVGLDQLQRMEAGAKAPAVADVLLAGTGDEDDGDDSELAGPDLVTDDDAGDDEEAAGQSAEIIPLRAVDDSQ